MWQQLARKQDKRTIFAPLQLTIQQLEERWSLQMQKLYCCLKIDWKKLLNLPYWTFSWKAIQFLRKLEHFMLQYLLQENFWTIWILPKWHLPKYDQYTFEASRRFLFRSSFRQSHTCISENIREDIFCCENANQCRHDRYSYQNPPSKALRSWVDNSKAKNIAEEYSNCDK